MNARRFYILYVLAAAAIIGLIMMLTSLWVPAKAALAQYLLEESWEHYQLTGDKRRPWPWADHYAIAQIQAPKQGVKQIVLSGDTGRSLAFAPGWNEQSGKGGAATVISAHRDTHFAFLKEVSQNDPIILQTAQGDVEYRVVASDIIDATKNKINPEAFSDGLILVTCYPFDAIAAGGPLRYLVFAEKTHPTLQKYVM